MDISFEKELISNENDELRRKNKAFEVENDILKNELNIMKCKIDVLENDIASLKVKSESLINDINKITIKRKSLDVRKYKIGYAHRNAIPYENDFVRANNNEKYEFVIKKEERGKWIPKMEKNMIPKTNSFGPKIKWVPKFLLVPSA